VIALDTNVLVYAHRRDSPHHDAALAALHDRTASGSRWAVPWPCVHEFLAVVTHPRLYRPASTVEQALAAVDDLTVAPGATLIGEGTDHLAVLADLLRSSGVSGPKVHDARVAAICLSNGVRELWTADRDFSYFPALRTRNPLVS
jgi:uncharacterized protein